MVELSDRRVRTEVARLIEEATGDFCRRMDQLAVPAEQKTRALAEMGFPDFLDAWNDYEEDDDD